MSWPFPFSSTSSPTERLLPPRPTKGRTGGPYDMHNMSAAWLLALPSHRALLVAGQRVKRCIARQLETNQTACDLRSRQTV